MIRTVFKKERTAFIPFIMAGHPVMETSLQAILALSKAGADLIELGVPFSDPVADGPVNQKAAEVALTNGMSLKGCLSLVQQARAAGCSTPIMLFSYLNPILSFGYESFAKEAKSSGIDGILIVDLPPEEGLNVYPLFHDAGLEFVLLASPTTDPHRLSLYQKMNPALVYYISRLAVTGMQSDLSSQLDAEVTQLRKHLPSIPIAVGFGISTPTQAATVAQFADGVIVGSVLVKALEDEGLDTLQRIARELASAIHPVKK